MKCVGLGQWGMADKKPVEKGWVRSGFRTTRGELLGEEEKQLTLTQKDLHFSDLCSFCSSAG